MRMLSGLILIFEILFLSLGCAKIAPPIPLKMGEEVVLERTYIPLPFGVITKNQDSVGVYKYDEASWLKLKFKEEIDTINTTGIKILDFNGEEVPFSQEWVMFEDSSYLILKPKERLSYNAIYVLKIIGSEVFNIKGEYIDVDKDGIKGEPLDDNFAFPFLTVKKDNSKGEWPSLEDKISPSISSRLFFFAEGAPSSIGWKDVELALYIYDYTWLKERTLILSVVDSNTIKKDKFKIVEENGEEIPLKEIYYIVDPFSPFFGAVFIKPYFLKAGKTYEVMVFGDISDLSGNKIGEKGSVVFKKKFKASNCNYKKTECEKDTIPPIVLSWKDLGYGFEVVFSEIIDSLSITKNSIYLEDDEGNLFFRNECGNTFVRFLSLKRKDISGKIGFVTEEIKDLSGNKLKERLSHYFGR
ncbi:MAG: hypothetical protein ABIN61_02430 [candidate division WOR-3 bacterium]